MSQEFYIVGWAKALNKWGRPIGTAHLMAIKPQGAGVAAPLCGSKSAVSEATHSEPERGVSKCPQCRKRLMGLEVVE